MFHVRDPHEVLGLPLGAGPDDVKRAYRKLAAKFHPDKKDGDAEKFREVTEAFDALKTAPNAEEPIFIDEDATAELTLTLEEMAFGCRKTIVAKIGSMKCKACLGGGFVPGSPVVPCITCLGTGKAPSAWGFNRSARSCAACKGVGTVPLQACKPCAGRGKTRGEAEFSVNVPAGVESGQELGFGNIDSRMRGRLFVRILGIQHARFDRIGDDLIVSHKLNVFEAMRGCTTSILGLDGKEIAMTVPAGIQPGECMVVQGCGIRNVQTGRIGNLRVKAQVEIPQKMSPRAVRLVEELADEFTRK